jgi:hypothetical protein
LDESAAHHTEALGAYHAATAGTSAASGRSRGEGTPVRAAPADRPARAGRDAGGRSRGDTGEDRSRAWTTCLWALSSASLPIPLAALDARWNR